MAGQDRRLQPIRLFPEAEERAGDHLSLPQMEVTAAMAGFTAGVGVGVVLGLMLLIIQALAATGPLAL
jgi:hypothetical protein